MRGSGTLKGARNEKLPLAFLFSIFIVIYVDCQLGLFSLFSFLTPMIRAEAEEKLIFLLISIQSILQSSNLSPFYFASARPSWPLIISVLVLKKRKSVAMSPFLQCRVSGERPDTEA